MQANKTKRRVSRPNGAVTAMFHPQPSKTDPQGSWTRLPADPDEIPVQDADDL